MIAMKTEADAKTRILEANVTRLEEKVKQMELHLFVLVDWARQKQKSLCQRV